MGHEYECEAEYVRGKTACFSLSVFQQTLLLHVPIALCTVGAFVVVFLTLGDPNLKLNKTLIVELPNKRNNGHTLAFGFVP